MNSVSNVPEGLNIYIAVQKQATERTFANSLRRAFKKLHPDERLEIRNVLHRMATIPELRAMTTTEALELLAKAGLAIA